MKLNYYAPTPKKWRQIGDALLAVSAFVTASTIGSNNTVAIVSVIVGAIGKFLTNFFSE